MATNEKFERWACRFDDTFGKKLASIDVCVFVCGPNMDKPGTNPNSKRAVRLRKEIFDRCRDSGIPVKGEHKKLEKIGRRHLSGGFNLCTLELSICEQCDLIILFPSSPGSFAESGLFCNSKEICRKMIVIIDKKHEKTKSFLLEGPIKLSAMRRARVLYHDYDDIEGIWEIVDSGIQDCRAKTLHERLIE